MLPVLAAEQKVTIGYEPLIPNFTAGEKNVVYVILDAKSDTIAAAKISLQSTGGVGIVEVLDPVDETNKLAPNIKVVDKKTSPKVASETILIVQSGTALPSLIKIPVVIQGKNGKSGSLELDTQKSQIINSNGISYTLQQSKKNSITFSQTGKTNSVVPTPTSLPANAMTLHITTKLQGTSPAITKQKTVSGVRVQLVRQTNNKISASLPHYINLTMNDTGTWEGDVSFTGVQPGSIYQLLIKGPKHLQKRICENTPVDQSAGAYECSTFGMKLSAGQNELNFSGITLMSGDVGIQDGILNSYDLSFIQNIIKKTASSSLQDGDINYDGKVNKTDYNLIVDSLLNTSGLDQR